MTDLKYPTNSTSVLILLCFSLTAAGLAIIFSTQLANRAIGKSNQAYTRTMTCIASVAPTRRTPEYVKSCYVQAEKATDTKIDRYGDAK